MNLPKTEQDSLYPNLSSLNVNEVLKAINFEDNKVALEVEKSIDQIANLVNAIVNAFSNGGRLFYIGAGTSGRLGILDASECPPTFGVPHDMVVGIIAGGDNAIRKAVEFAEDDTKAAFNDLIQAGAKPGDVVVGLSASGTTPYVLGGLKEAKSYGLVTACICCNVNTPISKYSIHPIEIEVGPEVVTGSTRMKSGTAQKMVLNMLTTASMVKIGKISGSKMHNMQLSNDKLVDRGTRMIIESTGLSYEESAQLLKQNGSVKLALEAFFKRS